MLRELFAKTLVALGRKFVQFWIVLNRLEALVGQFERDLTLTRLKMCINQSQR